MKKVLFIDDEKYILKTIQRKLKNTDIQGYYASDGNKGLNLVEMEDIDVIFTDLMMPHTNGLTVVEELYKVRPNCVVVVLSGNAQTSTIVRTMNTNHVYKYLVKPWKIDDKGIEFINECLELAKRKKEEANVKIKEEKVLVDLEAIKQIQEMSSWFILDKNNKIINKSEHINLEQMEILKRGPYTNVSSNIGDLKLFGN